MTNTDHSKQNTRVRFRISLLLLTGLLIAKLFWTPGNRADASNDNQTTAQSSNTNGSFTPVGDENAKVWGLAGSLLNLFSGGGRSAQQVQSDWEEDEARRLDHERARNKEHWEEYDQRRETERAEREDQMYEERARKQAEEQERSNRQQQEDYQRRQQEQGF